MSSSSGVLYPCGSVQPLASNPRRPERKQGTTSSVPVPRICVRLTVTPLLVIFTGKIVQVGRRPIHQRRPTGKKDLNGAPPLREPIGQPDGIFSTHTPETAKTPGSDKPGRKKWPIKEGLIDKDARNVYACRGSLKIIPQIHQLPGALSSNRVNSLPHSIMNQRQDKPPPLH